MRLSRRIFAAGLAALATRSAFAGMVERAPRRAASAVETILSRMASGYYDVVIYGGTIAGIAAARTAVARGAKALLLEPTGWLGGASGPGGVTPYDVKYRDKVGGTFWRFAQIVGAREKTATKAEPTADFPSLDPASPAFFSALMTSAQVQNSTRALYELAFSSGADILIDAALATTGGSVLPSVRMAGATIAGLVTGKHGLARGRVFIDASYEGDVLAGAAAAGQASYTIGREASGQYGESLAGFQPGAPAAVPGVNLMVGGAPYYPLTAPPLAAIGQADARVQAPTYRVPIALASAGQVAPFFQPAGYDPLQFALAAAVANAGGFTKLTDIATLYVVNGSEFGSNDGTSSPPFAWWNQGADYGDATPARRAEIAAQCKAYVAGLFYFAANDPSMPAALRADAQRYGYLTENYSDNGYFPPQMYLREGRRMVGATVVTQAGVVNGATVAHPVGWTSYYLDIHSCGAYAAADGSSYQLDGTFYDTGYGQAQIPMEALTPQPGQCGNLLVPVCASYSHVAWGPFRMEASFAACGDACGVMAATMAAQGKSAQALDYAADVAPSLAAVGANLS